MSYCLVPADRPLDHPCPICGCPAGTHIRIDDKRYLCVACDYIEPEKDIK